MATRFRAYQPHQILLLPPKLKGLGPERVTWRTR